MNIKDQVVNTLTSPMDSPYCIDLIKHSKWGPAELNNITTLKFMLKFYLRSYHMRR